MKKKIILWIVGILGVAIIGVGAYAYNIYTNVHKTLQSMNQPLDRSKSDKRDAAVNPGDKKPISILIAGYDQRPGDSGRSDSLMLMTLNPSTQSMKLLSIPRDTYTEIVGKGTMDKINHAFAFGGMNMSVNTVENFLNIPVDYYIAVNMEGFQALVDAVGGVDLVNNQDFTQDGMHFAKGTIHLDGEQALAYTRMRHEDPNGDFGRQMRQQTVLEAIIKKGANVSSLSNYGSILSAIQKNVKTNLTQDDMVKIQQNYKDCSNNKEQLQINGEGKMMNGIWYYVVSDQTRNDLSKKLREHLALPVQ
ncbi:LytR family transcriptional regulator [Ectobacillus polymachus]|uniref:polyisoprenyl-teichoic acid--peptidoglycan teichoic acid transferase TagU n=1 Tax=Ectobacillus polymachus TaxID=1508806 RepID=UPI003A8BE8EE